MRGSDDESEWKRRWSLWLEVMRSISGSDDKGGGDDEGEKKWRWLWTEATMKKKVNGNEDEGISVSDDENVDGSQLKER